MGSIQQPYPPGIRVPCLTWFKSDDTLESSDWQLQEEHLELLVSSGLHGIVIAGTNGEAATLTLEEKSRLVSLVVPAIVFADAEERESNRASFFKVIHFAHDPRLART